MNPTNKHFQRALLIFSFSSIELPAIWNCYNTTASTLAYVDIVKCKCDKKRERESRSDQAA